MRDIAIFLSMVPATIILWNQARLEKTTTWFLLRWVPLLSIFVTLLLTSLLIPQGVSEEARGKLGRRLLFEALFGYLVVVVIYIAISIRVVYGNRGLRPFWADLKARMFGNGAHRK
jgi:hypothetical protein